MKGRLREGCCADCGSMFTYFTSGSKPRPRCDECRREHLRTQARIHKRNHRRRKRLEESDLGLVTRDGQEPELDAHYAEPCTCGGDYMTMPLGHRCEGRQG